METVEKERVRRATNPTTDDLFKDLQGVVRADEVICRIISDYERQGETKDDYDGSDNVVKLTDMHDYLTELAESIFDQIRPRPSI